MNKSSFRETPTLVCGLENKLSFSFRAHLVPTFTFGETEVYDQVVFHQDSRMYKFQSFFRRIFGFYFCVFYGQGFRQGSLGLLPYSRPIVTVGEFCSQPQSHYTSFATSISAFSSQPPPASFGGSKEKLGGDLDCQRVGPREGEKAKGRED